MKKIYIFFCIVVMLIVACKQTPKVVPVDLQAEEAAVNGLLDKLISSSKAGDKSLFLESLTEDPLVCGTDPSEFWNKQQILEMLNQDTASTNPEPNYISDRVIKVAPDGTSAIVVVQFLGIWSPKIPIRQVYHFVKVNDKWLIQFVNYGLIPKNEDIQKLNEAIE